MKLPFWTASAKCVPDDWNTICTVSRRTSAMSGNHLLTPIRVPAGSVDEKKISSDCESEVSCTATEVLGWRSISTLALVAEVVS